MKELAERIQKQVELDDQRRRERERARIDKFDEETPIPGTKPSKTGKKEPVRAEMILKVKSQIFKFVESIGAMLRSLSQPALPSRAYQ